MQLQAGDLHASASGQGLRRHLDGVQSTLLPQPLWQKISYFATWPLDQFHLTLQAIWSVVASRAESLSPLVSPLIPSKSEFIPPIGPQPLARQSRAPVRSSRHTCGSDAWRSKPRPRTRSWGRTRPHSSEHSCVCAPCRCVCASSAGTLPSRGASDKRTGLRVPSVSSACPQLRAAKPA